MKKLAIAAAILVTALGVTWAFQVATAVEPVSISALMPEGAVFYLEAKDLAGLLREWSTSPEKREWLKSDNYQVFSRSRLFLRLHQVQEEFDAAAGVPPDMDFLNQVAGQQSALGIYDIGGVEMLYITRLPSARAMQSALWQKRAQFEPREAAGRKFYVRVEPKSRRVVAFAVEGEYLLLATREDLMAGALSLMAGQKLATLAQDRWFADAVNAGKEPGDLRMVIHLSEVATTPQFRTYWVQQNITELQQYESALTDLYRLPAEYREERVLLPADPESLAVEDDGARAVADLLRLVPEGTGFYRASARPSVDDSLALLEEKVLAPRLGPEPPPKTAPSVQLGEGTVGSDSNLEVRIDVPPVASTAGRSDEPLKAVLEKANVRAVLALHRSEPAEDGVFVHVRSTLVLSAGGEWNQEAVRSSVQRLVAPALTVDALGVAWRNVGSGAQTYAEFDGLAHVAVAVRGKYLIIGNDGATVAGVLAHLQEPVKADPVIYAAAFDHARERQNFYRFTALVDQPSAAGRPNVRGMEPEFFSQNASSLSRVFADVQSQNVSVRRTRGTEKQTVRYLWSH